MVLAIARLPVEQGIMTTATGKIVSGWFMEGDLRRPDEGLYSKVQKDVYTGAAVFLMKRGVYPIE